ncbi:nitrite reductase [Comamonas antarctica]|uniref:Nitrite reductase n=1 Tax=Comamonas antarctica TaxID=2743470 RepID=A0A6N1X2E8_9BURK|nr:nitrite reductase [Comamonas antarctica]QKV52202.1 nitrite reductase [Comamonas antarctica]
MADPIQVQGWCPTAWQPMRAQDGWILRVRPHCAAISAAQWRVLAQLALAHAHPAIELTRLGNVQLRGVDEAQVHALRRHLIEAALVPADADADLAPAVHCTPLYQAGDATHALARQLSAAVLACLNPQALARQRLAALPSKFGLLVDDPARRMRAIGADLQLWVADGGYGLALADAAHWHGFASADAAVDAAMGIALWFARERAGLAPAPTRLRGLPAHRAPPLPPAQPWSIRPAEPLGPGPLPGHGTLIGAPLGRIDAAALLALATQLSPAAEIRVTPWRSLLLEGEAPPALDAVHWIIEPADARLRVSACTGAPRCAQGHVPAQTLALALAGAVPPHRHLHVSGCAKCCALSADAAAVVVASRGATGQPLLHICRADAPGTPIHSLAATEAPAQITRRLHDLYL